MSGFNGGIGDLLGALAGGRGGAEGLDALVGRLREGGLADQVDSWVGPGANKPVAPDQLAGVFGQDELAGLAQRFGGGESGAGAAGGGAMATMLAALLPQLINALTPQGRVPQSDAEYGSGGMGGLLAQMMGGQGGGAQQGGGGLGALLGGLMGGGGAAQGQATGGLGAMLGALMGGAGGGQPAADDEMPNRKPPPLR
jgi:uncharacterized protein YidB (DUF937 family)